MPLTGAGAVGYGWRLEVSGEVGAIRATTGPEHPPPPLAECELHGGSVPQALFIEALEPGRALLRLALERCGKPSPTPRESHEIVVIVR